MKRTFLAIFTALVLANFTSAAPPKGKSENDKKIDNAIKQALEYLKQTQNSDGSWSDRRTRNPAITSLCVMAFLSAGHVPDEGPYAETVKNGIRAVLRDQRSNGLIANNGGHEMYHHGICSIMLAEVVGMTQDKKLAEDLREGLKKAVRIILTAQRKRNDRHRGGWRYRVAGYDSDMSVTGWQILALRAARNVGCDVPPQAIKEAVDYVIRCQRGSGGFCYSPGGGETLPCTGTGVLALELCGKKYHRSKETLNGGKYLMRRLPRWNDTSFFFYSIYYRSQACFQLGGNYWEAFRDKLHPMLLGKQSDNGSWRGGSYGYSYSTAMCVLALTVEYRFLPIYQRGNEPIDRK